ncbi:MAG: hypothetical protein K8T89_08640 [Planctomycetes bacterium]|nr:hypothetical protein [Planctomycetota bacterium]
MIRVKFGMLVLALAAFTFFATTAKAEDHVGPHKGAIVEWGEEEYHLELVPDAKTGILTVYVYGGEADLKKAKTKPIEAKTLVLAIKGGKTLKLEAKPSKDDPEGKSSIFTAKDDLFTKDTKLEGSVSGKVGAKAYTGDFKQK